MEGAVTYRGKETHESAFLKFSGQSGFFLTNAETPWYVAAIRELIVPDFLGYASIKEGLE
jgi:hypothetical protein